MIPLRDNITSKRFPFINWALILINVYVFYWMLKTPSDKALESFISHYAVVPRHLWGHLQTQGFTLITATFLHGGWLHIIFNMLFLHIFGHSVEDRMEHFRYLIFYIMAGIIANGAQAYLSPTSSIPLIGASGAIAGVLGAYFFYYPHARILTLIPFGIFSTIREIPAFFFLGFWFLSQMLNGTLSLSVQVMSKQSIGGVAWWAHAAGFVIGLLMAPAMDSKKGRSRR